MVVLQDRAHEVVSPAYDSLSVAERQRFRADHPHSYLHVTRSAEDEPDAATVSNSTLVSRGRSALEEILRASMFASHGSPAFYVYRLVDGAHTQCGLVCEVPSDYYHSVAKPHEATRAGRAALLAEHFGTVKAMSSPVACTVRDDGSLERELDAVTHSEQFWTSQAMTGSSKRFGASPTTLPSCGSRNVCEMSRSLLLMGTIVRLPTNSYTTAGCLYRC